MRIDVISIFPELVEAVACCGITGKARERGLFELVCWNPRDYTHDRHRSVDDRPYGGGPGMVMKVAPLHDAVQAARAADTRPAHVILMSPQGRLLEQASVSRLASVERLILVAGRYEGIDERFVELDVDEECSIGDYVLSGGELAAMVLIDACVRLLPEALGGKDSALQDSFSAGLLDCPHYTRPECIAGLSVPEVLLSGHHQDIERWRHKQALGRTWQRRSELLDAIELDVTEQRLLAEYQREHPLCKKA